MRATKSNIEYFESQKALLESENQNRKLDAEKELSSLENIFSVIIRSASESGQLYGSVTTRDIAKSITDETQINISRSHVLLEKPIKNLGVFEVTVALHPEVKTKVFINVARSEEEAKLQKETLEKENEPKEKTNDRVQLAAEIALQKAEEITENISASE